MRLRSWNRLPETIKSGLRSKSEPKNGRAEARNGSAELKSGSAKLKSGSAKLKNGKGRAKSGSGRAIIALPRSRRSWLSFRRRLCKQSWINCHGSRKKSDSNRLAEVGLDNRDSLDSLKIVRAQYFLSPTTRVAPILPYGAGWPSATALVVFTIVSRCT
ncbi:MAG TPA: hypothetical protein DC054_18655 [Blastocatellia bacterium]|nr:hypothetical protein [Blastocatellia bacterium]